MSQQSQQLQPNPSLKIAGVSFQYLGEDPQYRWETFRFYNQHLRGFLAQHPRRTIWIKGAGKQDAALIFYSELREIIVDLIAESMTEAELGQYRFTPLHNPRHLIEEALSNRREFIGLLELTEGRQIGSPLLKYVPRMKHVDSLGEDVECLECAKCGQLDYQDLSPGFFPEHQNHCKSSEHQRLKSERLQSELYMQGVIDTLKRRSGGVA